MLRQMGFTHKLLSSSFLGIPYRILSMHHKKELLRGLWVGSIGGLMLRSSAALHPSRLRAGLSLVDPRLELPG